MPNHVKNRCVITGPEDRIREFKEKHFSVPDGERNKVARVIKTLIPA